MRHSSPVDGFRLAYDRTGSGRSVVLLHGWPGDRGDFREVVPRLGDAAELVVPDLRGFGESDRHAVPPREGYSGAAQARSVVGLIEELGWSDVVLGGYDVGSRVAQVVAQARPDLVAALAICPPVPGAGERVLAPEAQREFWYQSFHQLDLATEMLDGNAGAIRAYLTHFWSHWSGPTYSPGDSDLELIDLPDAGHFVPLEAPDAFATAIRETAGRRR